MAGQVPHRPNVELVAVQKLKALDFAALCIYVCNMCVRTYVRTYVRISFFQVRLLKLVSAPELFSCLFAAFWS